jgi:hypothetical protein
MQRTIVWEFADRPGLECLQLVADAKGVTAEGVVVLGLNTETVRLRYTIDCDPDFGFRAATLTLQCGPQRISRMVARDDQGIWRVDGRERPDLAPCRDIDVMATPFTNTLPIRRLGLAPGAAAEIAAAYIRLPDLEIAVATQEYGRLTGAGLPARYRYGSRATGFSAELSVDQDGLVVDYGAIWRRLAG